jgi:PAS domain S-box-containing protein
VAHTHISIITLAPNLLFLAGIKCNTTLYKASRTSACIPDGQAMEQQEVKKATDSAQRTASVYQPEMLARALLTSFPGSACFVIGHEMRFLEVEGAVLREMGHAPAELAGRALDEVQLPMLPPTVTPLLLQTLSGLPFATECHCAGRVFQLHGHPLRRENGMVEAVLVTAHDISELHTEAAALSEHKARLRLALDLAELGTWSWNLASGAGALDERAANIVGLPERDVDDVAQAQRRCVHPDDLEMLERIIAQGISSNDDFGFVYRVIHLDGSVHHVTSRARVITDASGRPVQLVGTNRDITSEREAELRLEQLYAEEQAARAQAEQANRLKDEFLAIVSHELRTPLTAFLGYAELLQRRQSPDDTTTMILDKLVQSAQAQAALIDDLLDVARIVSGKLQIELRPLDFIAVIYAALDTVRPAADAKALQIHIQLDPAAGTVRGDTKRLQQVVWNLLSNAIKFTLPEGQISVELAAANGNAVLRVRDTGRGIHPTFLPYVFERFRQADSSQHRAADGLGLGLAIVRHLVEHHGGSVEAESDGLGEGACFTVRLPLAERRCTVSRVEEPLAAMSAQNKPLPLRGLRVLVAEDQPAILDLLHELLITEGASVRGYTHAAEALAELQTWRPDVLISDIAMPHRDGYWLIAQVRALPPEAGGTTPALALTAHVREQDRASVLQAGFQQYMPKPVDASALCNTLLSITSPPAER